MLSDIFFATCRPTCQAVSQDFSSVVAFQPIFSKLHSVSMLSVLLQKVLLFYVV